VRTTEPVSVADHGFGLPETPVEEAFFVVVVLLVVVLLVVVGLAGDVVVRLVVVGCFDVEAIAASFALQAGSFGLHGSDGFGSPAAEPKPAIVAPTTSAAPRPHRRSRVLGVLISHLAARTATDAVRRGNGAPLPGLALRGDGGCPGRIAFERVRLTKQSDGAQEFPICRESFGRYLSKPSKFGPIETSIGSISTGSESRS
jgi:hypothetical protein